MKLAEHSQPTGCNGTVARARHGGPSAVSQYPLNFILSDAEWGRAFPGWLWPRSAGCLAQSRCFGCHSVPFPVITGETGRNPTPSAQTARAPPPQGDQLTKDPPWPGCAPDQRAPQACEVQVHFRHPRLHPAGSRQSAGRRAAGSGSPAPSRTSLGWSVASCPAQAVRPRHSARSWATLCSCHSVLAEGVKPHLNFNQHSN